jgi:hypothetical protein
MASSLAAARSAQIALSGPARRRTEEARWNLNAACQWLWVLGSAVQTAQRHDPVSAADVALLDAIPVNTLTLSRVPSGAETVADLCQGTTACAERVRYPSRPDWPTR